MFASQPLKNLQTLPSDLKYESCVFDPAEQDMTMKENENQNATFYDSKSFRRETDPLTFVSKEMYDSDDTKMNDDPLVFETKISDENRKGIDDISMDNESGTVDSPRKDDGLSDHVMEMNPDQKQISPEHECSVTVEEFTRCNRNESRDPSSDLLETVANVFTDKNVLECELPVLEVMKDICVDNGRPENDKYLLESFKDDKSTHLSPQNPNDNNYCEAKEALSVENANGITANQCEIKEDNDGKLVGQERLKSFSVSSCDPPELVQIGKADCGGTNSSEEDSLVDKKFPIQEYGAQRTFLNSLDGEENKLTQLPDQISIGKAVSEEDVEASSLTYNSKLERGSITFNFSDAVQVQCTNSSIESLHEQSLIDSSANSKIQCVNSKENSDENVYEQSSEQQKDGNSDDFSSDGQVQSPSDKNQCSTNDDAPAVGPNDGKQERGNSGNDTAVSQWQYEQGETSFSAVTYSGPIALSGSLSHRSDASTTSARSFAFPILQSEWNSSPVRMAKADRRHFRKQKGWRSGILCCRF